MTIKICDFGLDWSIIARSCKAKRPKEALLQVSGEHRRDTGPSQLASSRCSPISWTERLTFPQEQPSQERLLGKFAFLTPRLAVPLTPLQPFGTPYSLGHSSHGMRMM